MRRILDIRIIRWELKLLYVIGALFVGWFVVGAGMRAIGIPDVAVSIVGTIIEVAALLLGARIFRGRGEPIAPPRAWWRMTARPALSRRLGVLFLVPAVVGLFGVAAFPLEWSPGELASAIMSVIEFSVVAALYLNSAVRLGRLPMPPKEPKFRPKVRLKP